MKNSFLKRISILIISVLALAGILTACNNGNNDKTAGSVPVYLGMEIKGNIAGFRTAALSNEGGYDEPKGGEKNGDISGLDKNTDQDNPFEDEINNPVPIEEKIENSLNIITTDKIEYYAAQNQDIYIIIRLSNPDSYEILSFTLNNEKYQSYQFQDGSDSQTLILKKNVGAVSGIVSYTIDAIKYVNGTEIKDVLMEGDKTVKAGVKTNGQTAVQITNEKIGLDKISFTVYLTDTYSLISKSDGYAKAVLYDGRAIVASREVSVGSNNVLFDGLNSNTKYQYAVFAYYDNLTGMPGGPSMNLMSKKALYTSALVLFDNDKISIGQQTLSFGFVWNDEAVSRVIKYVDLYHNGSKVKTLAEYAADNLLCNNEYVIVAAYNNLKGTEETIELKVTTLSKAVPLIEIRDVTFEEGNISFGLNITDTDYTGCVSAIELYKGAAKVKELTDLSAREFTGALNDTEYQIRAAYTYDLNDGKGVRTLTDTYNVTTLAKAAPTIQIVNVNAGQENIAFGLNVTDADRTGSVTAIELYKGAEKVKALENLFAREFTGLEDFCSYGLRIVYTYDLNDGEGARELQVFRNVRTLPHITMTSAKVLNTSVVSLGETVSLEAGLVNPRGVVVTKVKINGAYYAPSPISTAENLWVDIVIDGSFEGGITGFVFEELYYEIAGVEFNIALTSNNTAENFVNGELYVESLVFADRSYNQIEYAVDGQTCYYYITLKNRTAYKIDSITISGTVYKAGSMTVIDANHIAIPFINTLGWTKGSVDSITYSNSSLGTKTKAVSGVENWLYCAKNTTVEIRDAAGLTNMSQGCIYKLMNDIDLGGMEWQPANFEGVFEGNGHTVKNMRIVKTFENQDVYLGLFSTAKGVIKNLSVKDALFIITLNATTEKSFDVYAGIIAGKSSEYDYYRTNILDVQVINGAISVTNNTGSVYAGGLIGLLNGFADNCYATGNISAVTAATGSNNSCYSYTGGLIGLNHGVIINSYATGSINASAINGYSYAGGLVGYNDYNGIIENCYATGNASAAISSWSGAHAGGLVGYNNGAIRNCYATGNASAAATATSNNSSNSYAGGLAGRNGGLIEDCYAAGNASITADTALYYSNSYAGGLVGYNYGTVNNCHATGDVSAPGTLPSYYLHIGGFSGENYGAITNCYATGDMIVTASCQQLYIGGFAGRNSGGAIVNCYSTGKLIIGVSPRYGLEAGGFVGNGSGGSILNCWATGKITALINNQNSNTYAGGFAGHNSSNMSNCYAAVSIDMTGLSYSNVGGFVGSNYGTITDCYATGKIRASVNGQSSINAGGFAGSNSSEGVIKNCYATGDIDIASVSDSVSSLGGFIGYSYEGSMINCYAAGNVNGADNMYIGGFAGSTYGSAITNCYRYDKQTITNATNDLGAPCALSDLNTAGFYMYSLSWDSVIWDFSGLDFINGICPRLKI